MSFFTQDLLDFFIELAPNNNEDWFDFSHQPTNNFREHVILHDGKIASAGDKYPVTADRLTIVNDLLSYTHAKNPVKSGKLILNGNDRFHAREGRYFNLVQPFQHHENVPNNPGINVYSFALKPEEHQPSGTLNMSRIDTAILDLEYEANVTENSHQICIYAVNYNVLRILSGMGGIAYSN